MNRNFPLGLPVKRGFTLVELLAVMTIIVVVAGLGVMFQRNASKSMALNTAGRVVNDQIVLARQEAVSTNKEVQVIFLKLVPPGGTAQWKAMQIWKVNETPNGPSAIPFSHISLLSSSMAIMPSSTLSPLLTADPYVAGSDPINHPTVDDSINTQLTASMSKMGQNLQGWARLRFRTNGAMSNTVTQSNNFITLANSQDTGNPPPNYCTIQVNPITGKVTTYRP